MNIPDALCLLSAPASITEIPAPVDLLIVVLCFVLVPAIMLLDVSYVGSFSTHQIVEPNINQPTPNADVLAKRVSMESVRPYYGFGSITYRQMAGLLRYNSMQAALKQPVTKGLFLQSRSKRTTS